VIRSFRDKRAAALFHRIFIKGVPAEVAERAHDKLLMIDAAERLDDLRNPPGNRLEALRGDRIGQYAIRVSGKWRVCLRWRDRGAEDVEFRDYH
jgi:toxin HigB-1